MIVLNARDLAAAETTGAAALDALGAGAHGAAHGVLHRAAVRNTLLKLLGDVLSDELSVHVGIADLDDVELDHTRTRAVHEQGDDVVGALDLDLGHARAVQGLLEELADVVIFNDQVADLLVLGIPTGVPVFDDANAHAVGINFLSHKTVSSLYSFSATASVT